VSISILNSKYLRGDITFQDGSTRRAVYESKLIIAERDWFYAQTMEFYFQKLVQ
jgi:hypothetical protein